MSEQTHPATDDCDDTCPTWLHSDDTCCHSHESAPTPDANDPSAQEGLAGVLRQVSYLERTSMQIREQGDVRQVLLGDDGVGEAPSLADELWVIAFNLRNAAESLERILADRLAAAEETNEHLRRGYERQKAIAEDYEGRYETSHDSRMYAEECFRGAVDARNAATARAESATAAHDALVAGIEGLAEEWDWDGETHHVGAVHASIVRDLRALLSDSTGAGR